MLFVSMLVAFYKGRFNKIKINGWIYPSGLAGWVSLGQPGSAWVQNPTKKTFFKKKYKVDQNGLIHPENSNFSLLGGSGQIFGLIVRF